VVVSPRDRRPPTRIDIGEKGRTALSGVLSDFLREQDVEFSDLRLRLFVDHLEDHAGRLFYNKGIEDASAASTEAQSRFQDDLDLLRRI
jgi:uncharacterized protein (DUF2164 family)